MSSPVYAEKTGGVDFTRFGKMDSAMRTKDGAEYSPHIPKFREIGDAVMWAYTVKFIPEVYLGVKILKENTAILALMNQHCRNKQDGIKLLETLRRYEHLKIIASIMERYRDDGVFGDMAMVNVFDITHFTDEEKAEEFARRVRGSEKARRIISYKLRILYKIVRQYDRGEIPKSISKKYLIKQTKIMEKALKIIVQFQREGDSGDDSAMTAPGAVVHSYSIPMYNYGYLTGGRK